MKNYSTKQVGNITISEIMIKGINRNLLLIQDFFNIIHLSQIYKERVKSESDPR